MAEIRRSAAQEWRQRRLAALADAPDAFGADLEQERQYPPNHWQQRSQSGGSADNGRALSFYRKLGFSPWRGALPQHPAFSGCAETLAKLL